MGIDTGAGVTVGRTIGDVAVNGVTMLGEMLTLSISFSFRFVLIIFAWMWRAGTLTLGGLSMLVLRRLDLRFKL